MFAIDPCKCRGSIQIHQSCLKKLWNRYACCGICKTKWNKPKKYNRKEKGIYQSWYENGQLYTQCNYKNGILEGLYQRWHEKGQLCEQGHYRNGQLEGLYQRWYENGQLQLETNYKNGKPDGLYSYLDEDGELQVQYNYINGQEKVLFNHTDYLIRRLFRRLGCGLF